MNIFEETDLAGILMPYQFETGGEIDEKILYSSCTGGRKRQPNGNCTGEAVSDIGR